MKDGYYILIKKLENFIKRYYRFKIAKGFFIGISLVLFVLTIESTFEYYNYTSILFRTVLFYLSLIFFISITYYYVIVPILSLLKIGKRINFKQAADIISKHFDAVDDNLINTIELGKDIKKNHNETDLLIASIEQRTAKLNPIPFKVAISIKSLKKPFFYLSISSLIIILIVAFAPGIFIDGTSRIIDYNRHYEPKAPFNFVLNNNSFFIKKGNDFNIDLSIVGERYPNEVYVSIGENTFLMLKDKEVNNEFLFTIKNLNNSIDIFFIAEKFTSKKYRIEVLPSPILKGFIIEIVPPKYTGIENLTLKNSGDLNVPFGSMVKWSFTASFSDMLILNFKNDSVVCSKNKNLFVGKKQMLKSDVYSVVMNNKHFTADDNTSYQVSIIPDIFPEIYVNSVRDSAKTSAFYYMVNVKDDYGFKKLTFNYRINNGIESEVKYLKESIKINKGNKNQDIFFYFDFDTLKNEQDNNYIEYFFEIFDNDYISGYKSVKSSVLTYRPKSRKENKKKIEDFENSTEKSIDKSKKLVEEITKEIKEFKKKELNNNVSDWDRKNFIKSIQNKQKELNKYLGKIKNENLNKNKLSNQLYSNKEELIKKQKEIQKILDEIMDDELKNLLKELEKLQKDFNINDFDKLNEKLDLSYKDLNKNLDKSLELLKRFQVEEKVQNLSDDLNRLSKRLENLSEKEYKRSDREEQKVNQKSIKDNFKSLKKDLKDIGEKNNELNRPYKLEKFDTDFNNIDEKLKNIEDEIENKSDKKINKKRKDASESMKELAEKMSKMLEQMNMQSLDMNLQDLRQIIENLSKFSFNQENIYNELKKTFYNDPKFGELIKQQNKIKDDFELINDSLVSLASRIPQMSQMLTKEVKELNFSINKTLSDFEARRRRSTIRFQRNVINSSNILALYLEELNDQIQNQMSQSSSGKGKKGKPKNSMQKLKQQQESLKQQLEQLLKELKKNGGKKSGSQMNKGIVKSLAEQEIFNKMLNELQNSEGLTPESMRKLKEIKRLSDNNIKDLINRNITPDLLKRNENIKTRLLEAEKSEREREKEKTRESKEGENYERKFPVEIENFLKQNKKYKETLQKNNLDLKKYYQNLSKDYYKRIKLQ